SRCRISTEGAADRLRRETGPDGVRSMSRSRRRPASCGWRPPENHTRPRNARPAVTITVGLIVVTRYYLKYYLKSVPVHSGLDGVLRNGVGADKALPRGLNPARSHHSPLSAIPTAQGPPCHS